MLKKIGLYKRTLQYLTLLQIIYKLIALLKKSCLYRTLFIMKIRFNKNLTSGELETNFLDFFPSNVHALFQRKDRLRIAGPENEFHFTFLNKSRTFVDSINWHPEGVSFLWRYNLHYLDYAYDLAVAYVLDGDNRHYNRFKLLVTDWCKNNPLTYNIGWDPYPTSLRMVNWIKAYNLFSNMLISDLTFKNLISRSLYQQALFLENNIEYHLMNNHIIENGRALFMTGIFFNGKNAKRWRKKGLEILWQELQRQVADDGGHFELSPMYHTVVLLNYIEVVSILKNYKEEVPDWVMTTLQKMINFLKLISMPEYEIAYFNDAANGMTISISEVFKVLKLLGYNTKMDYQQKTGGYSLPDSGYYIIYNEKYRSKCIFDCGQIGPDYQPGHGHCDTLSFVWAYNGQNVIVDSGVDDYYADDIRWRNYYRSTRSHNTVEVDDVGQSEIWGRFRVGRRAYPLPAVKLIEDGPITYVQASHDGYLHLPGNVLHERIIAVLDGKILIVFDQVQGNGRHSVKSYLHLHPKLRVGDISNKRIRAYGDGHDVIILPFGQIENIDSVRGQDQPVQGWYSPEFGIRLENDVLVFSGHQHLPAYLGYCIVPVEITDPDNTSLEHAITKTDCSLNLKHNNNAYRIMFSSKGVSLS